MNKTIIKAAEQFGTNPAADFQAAIDNFINTVISGAITAATVSGLVGIVLVGFFAFSTKKSKYKK